MQKAGVQFHEGIPEIDHLKLWPPHGRLLVLDDLMAEGGEGKELLDLFAKHSHHQNITVIYRVKTCFRQENTVRVFPEMLNMFKPDRVLGGQLGLPRDFEIH